MRKGKKYSKSIQARNKRIWRAVFESQENRRDFDAKVKAQRIAGK